MEISEISGRMVADSFHIGDHLQGGGNLPEVAGHRLLGEEELKAEALDLPLFLVDFLVVGNRFFCLIDILAQKRVDRIADCLGDLDPHRNHFIVQLFQLAVKSVTHKFLSFQLPKMDLQQFARISRTGR